MSNENKFYLWMALIVCTAIAAMFVSSEVKYFNPDYNKSQVLIEIERTEQDRLMRLRYLLDSDRPLSSEQLRAFERQTKSPYSETTHVEAK